VVLPGPAPAVPKLPPQPAVKIPANDQPAPPSLEDPGPPLLRRAPHSTYPEDFEKDSALYCQQQIGHWTLDQAVSLLGEPTADRPAIDDKQSMDGHIYSFPDPTNHYRQMELDFDFHTGALRTVFVYPWKMMWQECRRIWGANVSVTQANKGRTFYSYVNRRLDVLVDPSGKVISIGLY
jgi:hypothetical protein